MKQPLEMSHEFLVEILDNQSVAIDATMGNGHDTLFLAQHARKVYAFDIQEVAITQTQKRLDQAGYTNVKLIHAGHEEVDDYVMEEIAAAIFNLGYLPRADKHIITKPQTTLLAIQKILAKLVSGGRIAIMVYYGHDGGQEEKDAVLELVSQLSQDHYTVMQYKPLNQIHTPPFLIMIEKK